MENLEKGFYNGKNDHTALWTTLQRLMPQWKDKEYTDFPRGRVLFDAMEEVFLVYSSQVISKPTFIIGRGIGEEFSTR